MSGRSLYDEGRSSKRARLHDPPTLTPPTQFTPNAYNDYHSRAADQQSVETTSRPASALAQALAAKALRVAKLKAPTLTPPTQFTPNAYNDYHSRAADQQSVETTSRPASALAQALAAKALRVAKLKAEKAAAEFEAANTVARRIASDEYLKEAEEKATAVKTTLATTVEDHRRTRKNKEFLQLADLLDLQKTDTNGLVRSSISCIKTLRGQRDYQLEHQQHAKQLTGRNIQQLQSETQNYRAQCLELQKANDNLRAANGWPPLNDRFDDDDDSDIEIDSIGSPHIEL